MHNPTSNIGQEPTVINQSARSPFLPNLDMRIALQLAALLTLSVGLTGCDFCENEISQSIISPSGKLKAVVFSRNCGATTGVNTQVSIIPASGMLSNDNGNTLILDGATQMKVEWRSDSVLHLKGLGAAKVFKQSGSVEGVSISYGS